MLCNRLKAFLSRHIGNHQKGIECRQNAWNRNSENYHCAESVSLTSLQEKKSLAFESVRMYGRDVHKRVEQTEKR